VSVARGGEQRAVHDDMLDGLEGCAALAGDLVWSVLGEESLRVFPGKGVSCNDRAGRPRNTVSKQIFVCMRQDCIIVVVV
jgi:hypothetical protein